MVRSALVAGIGWGLAETVINPLIASLYPDNKTAKLNAAHAWWPGGVVVGGLVGVGMSQIDLGWQAKLTVVLLPAIVCVILTMGVKFPPTERKAAGVSAGDMFKELLKPMFFVLFCSMFLTAASELAPGQWVDLALTRTVGMQGILLLVYVNGLMFVMRHFAGPLVHRLSPIGVLWCSCLGASLGLVALSFANSPVMGLLAATLWGTGVCYMWPTMLATASERFPRGGALLMGLMGTAGTLSIQFVLPIMGTIYDRKKIEVAGGEAAFNALQPGPVLERILGVAAQASFRAVAILPAVLLIVFGAIWLYDRSKGRIQTEKDLMSFQTRPYCCCSVGARPPHYTSASMLNKPTPIPPKSRGSVNAGPDRPDTRKPKISFIRCCRRTALASRPTILPPQHRAAPSQCTTSSANLTSAAIPSRRSSSWRATTIPSFKKDSSAPMTAARAPPFSWRLPTRWPGKRRGCRSGWSGPIWRRRSTPSPAMTVSTAAGIWRKSWRRMVRAPASVGSSCSI